MKSPEMDSLSPEKEEQMTMEQELMTLAGWAIAGKGRSLEQFVDDFNKKYSTGEHIDPKKVLEENISPEADPTSVFAPISTTYFDQDSGKFVTISYIFHIPSKTLLKVSEADLADYFERSREESERR